MREDTAERVRGMYDFRRRRFARAARQAPSDGDEEIDERSHDYQRLLRELLQAQRDELLAPAPRAATIGDDVMRRVERDLDLEETPASTADALACARRQPEPDVAVAARARARRAGRPPWASM